MVHRCTFCGSPTIHVSTRERTTTVVCGTCDAVFVVEFDPPDQPGIRGRIEAIEVPRTDEWTVH